MHASMHDVIMYACLYCTYMDIVCMYVHVCMYVCLYVCMYYMYIFMYHILYVCTYGYCS